MKIINFISLLPITSAMNFASDEEPGKATYYGGNENGNACGYNDLPKVSFPFGYASAAGGDAFDSGYGCGSCYEITCVGPYTSNPSCFCDGSTPSVVVQVSDQCPECETTHFDLNPLSMERIVGDGLAGTCGVIETTLRRVSCNFQSNIKIRSKAGTSAYWYGLHIDDVAGYGAISNVELRTANSASFDVTCDKSQGASFWICSFTGQLSFPMDVRLTDSAGRQLTGDEVISSADGGMEFDFGSNFEPIDDSYTTDDSYPTSLTNPNPTIPTSSPNSIGTATTTRYWDCSGGSCGCAYLPSHLEGDHSKPAHCHSNAMFAAPEDNPYGAKFYGAAAISQALGGGDWLSSGCGKCWKVTGNSNIANYDDGTSTTLVLKGTNYCPPSNPSCSDDKAHFDIAAPGFDFIGSSLSNTCAEREPNEIDAFESCGSWMIDSSDPSQNCDCNLFSSSVLRAGCENFKSLSWNNPTVTYEEISCPPELSQLPCWEENGNNYHPFGQEPELCMDPSAGSSLTFQDSPTVSDGEDSTPIECFSSNVSAHVKDKGMVMMSNLQVGDQVLTHLGAYQTLYAMDHHHATKETQFIQIWSQLYKDEPSLELTKKHMTFLHGNPNPVPASSIKIGDELETSHGPSVVTEIRTVIRDGIYSPLTIGGTIVVNGGIVASSYSSLGSNSLIEVANVPIASYQSFFDTVLKPYRFLCNHVSLNLCTTKNERVLYSELGSRIYSYGMKQNIWFRYIILLNILFFFGFMSLLSSFYTSALLFLSAYVYSTCLSVKKRLSIN